MDPVVKIGTVLSLGTVVEITPDSVIVENKGKRAKLSHRVVEQLVADQGASK